MSSFYFCRMLFAVQFCCVMYILNTIEICAPLLILKSFYKEFNFPNVSNCFENAVNTSVSNLICYISLVIVI